MAVLGMKLTGPFSFNRASNEEHPGPPFNHSVRGLVLSERTKK